MGAHWIIVAILCVSAWESAGITNKGRPLLQETLLRNFRHVAGPSASVNTDWEVGLREAVNQALLRERYHDYNLRERLLEAPLIGRQDVVTPFGDIVILARGQLYVTQGGNFLFIQDHYQNDCDACHNPRPRCGSTHCQTWRPEENEHLVALWTVKRLRHRNHNNGYYYELEYIVSPISPSISEFVMRNGHFDYGIPGHIFIVRNDKTHDQPEHTFVNNRRLPHPHFKPEVIIGITADGEKHVLQSYPGFYTSFPVHPTYHHHRYSTNDPREIELYKELIESLSAKTSSTQKAETGPYKFSLNGYTEATTNQVQSTKPSYDSFPTTQGSMMELSTRPLVGTTMVQSPQTTHQHSTVTKPSMTPTKPTELSTQEIFDTPKPITTIHYFTPIGEEDLITDGITEMQKITLGTVTKEPEETGSDFLFPETETTLPSKTTTKKYYKPTTITVGITETKKTTLGTVTKNQEETGSDFLFPETETTLPSKTTTKKYYKPSTITENVPNSLEEPDSSSSKTTKQYETTVARTKPTLPTTTKTTTTKTTTTKTTTLKPTTTRTKPMTTKRRPTTTKSRPSKPTTTKPEVAKTTTETLRTTQTSTTESPTSKITTRKITATTTKVPSTTTITTTLKTTTDVPSTTTMKTTTVKLRTTKTKLSNLTGFIASTTTGTKKITTYKPKFTTTKLTTTTKLATPETTRLTTQTKETTQQRTTVATTFTRPTRPQRPMIYLDYTLLEDISPTEPMKITSLKAEDTQPITLSTISMTNTTTPYTTVTTRQASNEFTTDDTATTKREGTSQMSFTSTTNAISTAEGISTATEPTQASTVTQENITDSAATSREETETTTQGTTRTTVPDSDEVSIVFSTDTTRNENPTTITTTFKAETMSMTSDTTVQLIESTTTSPTSRKPTVSKSKPSTTTNDFLTEDGNMEKPTFTKPEKADFDEYDIFGSTKPQTKPTKSPTVIVVTESDLASALFGSREEKVLEEPVTTPFKGTRIIYSNFFEASTTSLPDTSEYATQTESYETTTNFKPLTSQSYATSISLKMDKMNDTSTETDNNTTPSTTIGVDKRTETIVTTAKESKPDTRKTFDRLELQLVNHAKSIDYLNGGNNKTSRAKYKRRKTYVPKNRRLNGKQVT